MTPVKRILKIQPSKYFKGFKLSHVQGLLHGKSFLCESHPATVDTIKSMELCHFVNATVKEPCLSKLLRQPSTAQTLPCSIRWDHQITLNPNVSL